jgi:hypothetical protein
VTVTEGHPWRNKKERPSGDVGGNFSTTKRYLDGYPSKVKTYSFVSRDGDYSTTDTFTGVLFPTNPNGVSFPAEIASNINAINAKGATAVARVEPTNSVANAATFLGELVKDGLPNLPGMRLWKGKIRLAADAGDEFLNHVFGWLPLVSDVKQHAEAVRRADTVMKQYERDAGRVVRRRYHFQTERSSDRTLYAANVTPYMGPRGSTKWSTYLGRGNVYRTVETVRFAWFSGAFTYHLPSGYDSRNGMERNALAAKRVFGAELTPETLWELTPWSWAIDWFSNAQDVIHNLNAMKIYGLVLRYGYMMEHSINKVTYSYEAIPGTYVQKPDVSDLSFVTETKLRQKANPFGFGVSWDGLSPLQLAITAALGLSRT